MQEKDLLTIEDGVLTSCCRFAREITVSEGVITIDKKAFKDCTLLQRVTLPESVKWIGNGAFQACSSLSEIYIEGEPEIADGVFDDCSERLRIMAPRMLPDAFEDPYIRMRGLKGLAELIAQGKTISARVRTNWVWFAKSEKRWCIRQARENLSLLRFLTAERLLSLGETEQLLSDASLGPVILGELLRYREDGFSDEEKSKYENKEFSLEEPEYDLRRTWTVRRKRRGECAICSLKIHSREPQIPEMVGEDTVTEFGLDQSEGWIRRRIRFLHIPAGIKEIRKDAFRGCFRLHEIELPTELDLIGEGAFADCTSLTGIWIPEGIQEIGKSTFENDEKLTAVELPGSVTRIGERAFRGCAKIEKLTLLAGIKTIGPEAFEGCGGLKSITFPDTLTSVGGRSFANCSGMKEIEIPGSVSEIGEEAFAGCVNLESVTIQEGVRRIGKRAFVGCEKLKAVSLPESLTEIGDEAFGDGHPLCNEQGFAIAGKILLSYCGEENDIVLPPEITRIGGSAFAQQKHIQRVNFPAELREIGKDSFAGCGIRCLELPEGVETIEAGAFADCEKLTEVILPDSLKQIGVCAFRNCSHIKTVRVSAELETIGEDAFSVCSALTEITLPESLKNIDTHAFSGCKSLQRVKIPSSISVLRALFPNCTELSEVALPDGLKEIKGDCFSGCVSLQELRIPDSVRKISLEAFSGADKICLQVGRWSAAERFAIDHNICYNQEKHQ